MVNFNLNEEACDDRPHSTPITSMSVIITTNTRTQPENLHKIGRVPCVISPNSVALGPYYVKVVENRAIYSRSEM